MTPDSFCADRKIFKDRKKTINTFVLIFYSFLLQNNKKSILFNKNVTNFTF